ncbi:ABC transporter ATP-binding protein [Candidatus Bathyarchaeota archaeon]|nr:ABC transporter ATP-binding protein [Candidatus Bathyarchaeota archaeon]
MTYTILAEELTKEFNGFLAVNHINFKIKEGEIFGFLGPNGAGKTTTMRMIQGVSPKTSGNLKVKNMEVEEHPREVKKILGILPQENNLDPDFTVFKNLIVYARYYDVSRKEAEKRALSLLKLVHLEERKDFSIDKLSGGMKRRLMLARALINNPEILILDEPTTGLDPQARHLIWDKIKGLKREGVTIVLTTHYMEEAAQLCDNLVIMDFGRIIAEGKPQELISKHIGVKVLEVDSKPEVLNYLLEVGEKFEQFSDRICIFTRKPEELMNEITRKIKLEKTVVREASLEDVFLKLTGRGLRD